MTAVLVAVGIIAVLILLNGLFVAAEFSIVATSRAMIEHRASQGDRLARMVRAVFKTPRRLDRFIATAQLGITGASLGLGMYGEHVLAGWIAGHLELTGISRWIAAHALASVLAVLILTYFHIVVGEMVPKALALQYPSRTVRGIAPVMRVLETAFAPLVMVVNGLANSLLRIVGIDRRTRSLDDYRTAEDLEYIIQESRAGGMLRPEAARLIQELLDFPEITAGEVMVPRVRVSGLPVGAGRDEILRTLEAAPHARYPVYDRAIDRVLGIVHLKDLLKVVADARVLSATDAHSVPFVPETASIEAVLDAMRRERAHMAIVMDEHGGTAGIVTAEDLLEEVVGGIEEGPEESPEITRLADGRLRVTGTARVEETGEALGMTLEHDYVDSVSGLVLALLGRPPRVGDAVTYRGVRFEVTAVEGHGVRETVVGRVTSSTGQPIPPRDEQPL